MCIRDSFSIVFLKESVGILRWSALIFGLLGVLLVIKPFGVSFRWEIIFPLTAALAYSSLQILTRYLGVNEKAATMAFYIQISFITYMGIFSIFFHDGNFDIVNHPSFEFFFKGWVWPNKYDLLVICFIGVFNAFGGYLISQAYRLSFAGLVAPFEYSALVFSILGLDFQSSLGVSASSLGNVGPSIGDFGPSSTFYDLPVLAKWWSSFLMLLGRLELYTVLIIITPYFWTNR